MKFAAGGIKQRMAWFVLHCLLLAREAFSILKTAGTFEADQPFMGGRSKDTSAARRANLIPGSGVAGKEVVMGLLRLHTETEASKVAAKHVPNRKKATVQAEVRAVAEKGSVINIDSLFSYVSLAPDYVHQFVDHAIEFARDSVHTNSMEHFWPSSSAPLKGTYVSVEPAHLNAYVVEQVFRFNERKDVDGGSFRKVLTKVVGKRLTYKELTRHVSSAA